MKISELQAKLEELKYKHEDCELSVRVITNTGNFAEDVILDEPTI